MEHAISFISACPISQELSPVSLFFRQKHVEEVGTDGADGTDSSELHHGVFATFLHWINCCPLIWS